MQKGGETEKQNILIVDDEANIISSLKRLLRKEPYNVLTAPNGEEGLRKLEENRVSLIISDQRMPVMSGVEFLRKVKKKFPHTIRIILSGYTEVSSIMSAINEGEVYKFITKPWNDEEIKIAIKRSLEQYQLQRENEELYRKVREQNEKLEDMVLNLEKIVNQRTMDLKLRNEALLISQSIVENLPLGLAGVDRTGMVVMANKKIHEDFSIEEGAMVGSQCRKVFTGKLWELIENLFEKKGGLREFELEIPEKKFSLSIFLVRISDGQGVVLLTKSKELSQEVEDGT